VSRFTGISSVGPEDYPRVVAVWEASVRATHHFVTESDLEIFRPLVLAELPQIDLACVRDKNGMVVGFIGTAEGKVEMLFIHPDVRRQGLGQALLHYAIKERGATMVDVNEQNDQALGFYLRMGFEVVGRSELDSNGKPYPLFHMRLANANMEQPGNSAERRAVDPSEETSK
jgi:putative acetyltransferase